MHNKLYSYFSPSNKVEKIGRHISELLFDHDCVIVPSLGGFLASNQSSRILLPNHIIFPPYRRIAFNVYLKQNDGLLANYLVASENIPYSEATRRIESFTAECFENLGNGRKITITDIGTLFYDKEKNLQFETFRNINHLKDSFGMESVHFLPINQDEKVERKKLSVEKTIRPSLPLEIEKHKKFNFSTGKKVVGIAVIVAGLVWFSLNLYFVAPKHYESTSLNPFDSQNIVLSKTDSIRNIPSDLVAVNTKEDVDTILVTTVPPETLAIIENKSEIDNSVLRDLSKGNIDSNKDSAQPLPKESSIISVITNKHYLIAGVFKIKENAQSMILHLNQLGFTNPRIIEANNRSYVSYEEFDHMDDALVLADSLHRKNLEGWIWKH